MKIAVVLMAFAGLIGATPGMAAAEAVSTDKETLPGAPVYRELCAQCHDKAIFKAPAKSFLNMMAPDAIYSAISSGLMREQAASLNDEQKRQVADYVGDAALAAALRAAQPPMCAPSQRAVDTRLPVKLYSWGADLGNSHYSPGDIAGLTAGDISRLKLKWAFAYPGAQRARSQPTVAMGTLFVGSQDGTVYALDAKSGCVRWTYRASAEVRTPIVLSHRDTPAMRAAPPLAFFGDIIGRAYAVDAATGKLLWKSAVDDHATTTITGAPAYHAGRVYVSVSSLEEAAAAGGYECCTFRGSVVAFEARTGKQLWKRYMIDQEPAQVGTSKTGLRVFAPSGAAVWNSPTIDARRGVLYVGTGDNYSKPANDRSDAVIALDLKTGEMRWSHQIFASDAWNVGCILGNDTCPAEPGPDYDIGAGTTLMRTADGRDFVVAGLKSGHAIALDVDHPDRQAWARRLGRGGIEGGIQFALAHDTRNLYVPISDMQSHDGGKPLEPQHPGLYALDPATGALRWAARTANDHCTGRTDCDAGILSAVTATPHAVFAGHMDGRFRAYDPASGQVLWEYDTTAEVKTTSGALAHGGSIGGGGPAISGGLVYVNSGYNIYWHMPGNLLLAFSVDGK